MSLLFLSEFVETNCFKRNDLFLCLLLEERRRRGLLGWGVRGDRWRFDKFGMYRDNDTQKRQKNEISIDIGGCSWYDNNV